MAPYFLKREIALVRTENEIGLGGYPTCFNHCFIRKVFRARCVHFLISFTLICVTCDSISLLEWQK